TNVVHNNTTINNTTNNVTNVKNVTNITNVTIVAPPSATANGQAVNTSVPAQAHLAAAQKAIVKAQAPEPASSKPIPAFVHGRAPAALPPAQAVKTTPSEPQQARTSPPHPDSAPHPGRPQPDRAKQDKANKDLGKPGKPQVAVANAKGKSAEPGKQANVAKTPAKDKGAPAAAAKNKGEHPKKPGGKEEKPDHEKAG
ncbi:MAG TPA: hypothetical protein VGO18_32285, partial [Steroidobacteraceae bacterium]|nr:hypothetical protein [Steroidobacteraceae bacterium]